MILAPGDHLLVGGEVGGAFLADPQPGSDGWQASPRFNHLVPGHVEKPPKIGKCLGNGELHEQAASISSSVITILTILTITNLVDWGMNITNLVDWGM